MKIFILLFCLLVYGDDSIISSPYWNCNTCADTVITKVVQHKDYKGKPYVEVYYQINQFRKPTTFWVKVYK